MMVYLIKWAIALTLLYSLYGLTLRRETFHTLNRAVLLVILVVSAVLPLFHIPLGHETWLSQGFERLENALAPQPDETFLSGQSTQIRRLHDDDAAIAQSSSCNRTITIQQSNKPGSFHWATIFIGTYTLVTIAFWLAYLHSLAGVIRLIRRSTLIEERDGVHILSCPELKNSCSWMRWVLLANEDGPTPSILTHELAHVRLGHSWDKLLCELTCRTLWFLPFAWMLREDMNDVHEFEADRAVLRTGIDIQAYNQLLILKAVRPGLQPVVNAFNQSRIKKRITMMFKPKSNKWRAAKVLYLLPMGILSLAAFAKPVDLSSDLDSQQESTYTLDFSKPGSYAKKIVELDDGVVRIDGEPVTSPLYGDWLNDIDLSNVTVTLDEQGYIVQLNLHSKAGTTPKVTSLADDGKIYEVVEVMPAFPGGSEALYKWLTNNLHYPEAAKKQKVQGRVVVRFVVETDGSITDAKAVNSPNQLLSEEALRVVKFMPRWEPGKIKGKPVRSHFLLPITFKF